MQPDNDCSLCPRLADFRVKNRQNYPSFFNSPVLTWGETSARLLVVGEAPGLKGANRTGKPFLGDDAGRNLFDALLNHGLASGDYSSEDLRLHNCRITNAVRCVPPKKGDSYAPSVQEIKQCNRFLAAEIKEMPNLAVVLALGIKANDAVVRALGLRPLNKYKFERNSERVLPLSRGDLRLLIAIIAPHVT